MMNGIVSLAFFFERAKVMSLWGDLHSFIHPLLNMLLLIK
jgi:hypothetical protein